MDRRIRSDMIIFMISQLDDEKLQIDAKRIFDYYDKITNFLKLFVDFLLNLIRNIRIKSIK